MTNESDENENRIEVAPTENPSSTEGETQVYAKHRTSVWLSADEFRRIKETADTLGQSIPKLLRRAYFERDAPKPYLDGDSRVRLFEVLGRIGNNLNQIARRVNSGVREGTNPALDEIQTEFRALYAFLGVSRGHH